MVGMPPMLKSNSKATYVLFFLVILAFLISLRAMRLTADPPANLTWSGGYYGDEAGYAQNARNKVLFGKWSLDDWKIQLFDPILVFFDYLCFKLFGVSFFSLRFVALFWGILGILFVYGALKEFFDSLWVVFLGVILLETNYFFLMFTRLSLSDTMLTNWMLMTFFFWAMGLKKPAFRFFAGLSSVGILSCKPTAGYFAFVALISYTFHFLKEVNIEGEISSQATGQRWNSLKQVLRFLLPFIIGFASGFLIWLIFFYIPYHQEISRLSKSWFALSAPKSLSDYVSRTLGRYAPVVFKHFSWFPYILLAGWLYLPVSVYRLIRDRKNYLSIELFVLLWFVVGYFAISGLYYRPARYFISLSPPIILLAFFGFLYLIRSKGLDLKSGWGFKILYLGWLFLSFLVAKKYLHFPVRSAFYGAIVFAAVLIGSLMFKERFNARWWLKKPAFYIVVCLISLSLTNNLFLYYKWWHHPSYKVVDASRDIGKIVKHGIIAGLWAPMLCMENHNRTLCIAAGWGNDKHPYEKYHFTHLLLWRGNFDSELRMIRGPLGDEFIKKRLKLIKGYKIKGAWVLLFKVIAPTANQGKKR